MDLYAPTATRARRQASLEVLLIEARLSRQPIAVVLLDTILGVDRKLAKIIMAELGRVASPQRQTQQRGQD